MFSEYKQALPCVSNMKCNEQFQNIKNIYLKLNKGRNMMDNSLQRRNMEAMYSSIINTIYNV